MTSNNRKKLYYQRHVNVNPAPRTTTWQGLSKASWSWRCLCC